MQFKGEIGTNDEMIINMYMRLGPTVIINRTEENFPIGKATSDLETELKQLEIGGDGQQVFCNGN